MTELNKPEREAEFSINFLSESDKFDEATKEYVDIWQEEGERMIQSIEEISGLQFKTRVIDATVFEGISRSHPLKFRASYPNEIKKTTIVHELGHILLGENGWTFGDSLGNHKALNLILYDILESLYGKESADKNVSVESGRGQIYKEAWDWALLFNREERRQKFSELLKTSE